MKKIFTLLFCCSSVLAGAQTPYFQKLYGDVIVDDVQSITATSDSGYALVGGSGANALDSTDITVYRVNRFGDMLWARKYGDPKDEFANDIKQTSDNGFIIVGTSYASPNDTVYSDMYAMKIDDSGFLSWASNFGGSDFDEAQSVVIADDGGYLLFGSTLSYSVFKAGYVVKVDQNGFQQWAKLYNLSSASYFYRAHRTSDGNIIAVGGTDHSAGGTGFDHFVVKMDQAGQIIWSKRYGSIGPDWLYDFTEVSNGYIFTGVTTTNTAGEADQNVFKTDTAGTILWSYNYGTINFDRPSTITTDASGNIVIGGYTNIGSSSFSINQMTLHKLDSMGNTVFAKSYGNSSSASDCQYMIAGVDGGYALAGYAVDITDPLGDAYFVKTDDNGVSGCFESPLTFIKTTITLSDSSGTNSLSVTPDEFNVTPPEDFYNNQFSQICFVDQVSTLDAAKMISIFPNPSNGILTITQLTNEEMTIEITDLTGRMIKSLTVSEQKSTIHLTEFPNGIYLMNVTGKEFSISKRLIIQH